MWAPWDGDEFSTQCYKGTAAGDVCGEVTVLPEWGLDNGTARVGP